MALPPATIPFVMLLLLLVPPGCSDSDQGGGEGGGGGCFAPLIGCASPAPTTASATGNATAFRASLAPLLAALPSAAAAAEGFAALRSHSQPSPRHDRAHALGICFGSGGGGGDDASDCHACLRAAAAAATEGCANDTRRAAVWSDDGCLLAYYAGGDTAASSSYTDGGGLELEQTLADLAKALLAQPKGTSLWRKARSITQFVLAAIGAVTVVVLVCLLLVCYLLAETLVGNMAAAGPQAGVAAAGQGGEGLTLYIAGTNGQAQVWSLAAQFRFH